MAYTDILIAAGGAVAGVLIGLYALRQRKFDEQKAARKAEKLIADAELEGKDIFSKARSRVSSSKIQFEIEQNEFVAQLDRMEQMFAAKSVSHQKREARIEGFKQTLLAEEKNIHSMRAQTDAYESRIREKLIQITGFTLDNAKKELVRDYENEFAADADVRLQRHIEWVQECAVKDAKNTLAEALHKFVDSTFATPAHRDIIVPRDEIKGRIVGRGGRSIAFFEKLFDVDVIFNDEPNTIIIGCFNLVQRETARFALERLMREKVISEETIARVKPLAEQDMDKLLRKEGENALKVLGLANVSVELAKLIGRLKFRTSYGQNIMSHCFEVAYLSRMIAGEIGADIHVSWIAGFLHDIGKAVDQEVTGSHDVLSKEILERYGFSPEIVHAAWAHHNAIPQETVEAKIIQAADALSASRPGARAESLERYLAKITELQETALSFEGVRKAYAINAGREVRVIVEPEKIKDENIVPLAENIAAKIQEKGGYPGKIKVVTIRTTKTTEHAR